MYLISSNFPVLKVMIFLSAQSKILSRSSCSLWHSFSFSIFLANLVSSAEDLTVLLCSFLLSLAKHTSTWCSSCRNTAAHLEILYCWFWLSSSFCINMNDLLDVWYFQNEAFELWIRTCCTLKWFLKCQIYLKELRDIWWVCDFLSFREL